MSGKGKKVRGRACRPLGERNVQFKLGSCRTERGNIGSLVQATSRAPGEAGRVW